MPRGVFPEFYKWTTFKKFEFNIIHFVHVVNFNISVNLLIIKFKFRILYEIFNFKAIVPYNTLSV